MNKKHRIFIAINLPLDIKEKIDFYSQKWPELPAKWTAHDNIHITLEFLGYLTGQELADVYRVAKEVAERHKSFSIVLNKISYGPPKIIPPRMVWAVGESSDDFISLKNELEKELSKSKNIRFIPEKREAVPHITLARIKEWEWRRIEPEERPQIEEEIDLTFPVNSIEVMESQLKIGGPEYKIIESYPLKNNL